MVAPLNVDPIIPPYMRVPNQRRREANPVLPCNLKGKTGMRVNVLVEERRRLEQDNVVGRDLGEEVVVDGVEEALSVS